MHTAHNRPEIPAFMQTQFAFAGAIRDPQNAVARQDVDARHMAVYQELIYNNIDAFLTNAFPVLRRISSEEHWHGLMRDFLVEHRAKTPLFPEMPREFLHYLEHEREMRPHDYPFMVELAHYEWAELALGISEASFEASHLTAEGSPLHGVPLLSPLVWLCSYRYPVHRIAPDYLPNAPGTEPTHLLIYRDRDDEVGFMELNPVTARLIEKLGTNQTANGLTLLQEIADEMQHPNPQTVIRGGKAILENLQHRGIIGYRRH